jgi:hypothetical protein
MKFLHTVALLIFLLAPLPADPSAASSIGQVTGEEGPHDPDIEWFRDRMGISPKYVERHEGILGMSWPHFLVMAFLVLFFLGALVIVYLRDRRIKAILNEILKEEKDEHQG